MLVINAPKEYEQAMQEIIESLSAIPVNDETFHDTLMNLLGDVRRGAKDGLSVTTCTFAAEGPRTNEMFMPEDNTIKMALQNKDTALMVSDKNGAVFCLSYVMVGDKEYLMFLNPEAARLAANEERAAMNRFAAPAELTLFEKFCDMLSRLFRDRPSEAAARLEAYRNFYANMQENAQQLEYMTTTRPAEEYGFFRQQRINEQVEANKQAEEERQRQAKLKEINDILAKKEAERKALEEEQERLRKLSFENPFDSRLSVKNDEDENQADISVEEEDTWLKERENQISYWNDQINMGEFELKQLPHQRRINESDIQALEVAIPANTKTLEENRLHEEKLLKKINELKQQYAVDNTLYLSFDSDIEDLITRENDERSELERQKVPVDNCKAELDAAQKHFDEVNEGWEMVERNYGMMTMDPGAYLDYLYQQSKANSQRNYEVRQQQQAELIQQQEQKIADHKTLMKQRKGKIPKADYKAMSTELTKYETELKEMKLKVTQMKKRFEEEEKEHELVFSSRSNEKLEEVRQIQENGLKDYAQKRLLHEQALNRLHLTQNTYRQMLEEYQQKEALFNLKWETQRAARQDYIRQRDEADLRRKNTQGEINKLQEVYAPLKENNAKLERNLKTDRDLLETLKGMRVTFNLTEERAHKKIATAKEKLRELGAPVPEDEKELKQDAPVMKMN